MDYQNQINIINQAVKDTQYLKDDYKPSKGLVKVISTWFCMYAISELIFYIINWLNLKNQLYLYDWYFIIYDCFIIMVLFYPLRFM